MRAFTHRPTALLPNAGFDEARLLAPRAAIAEFFARAALTAPGRERVALADAFGRVLAGDIDADDDYPNAPRSAMDGFAIASSATPGRCRILGEVRMGSLWTGEALIGAAAVRLPTGGALPDGADCVVPIEAARVDGDWVLFDSHTSVGDSVTPRGSDIRRGDRALEAGRWIGASELAVLATLGVDSVPVYRRPNIAVLSSGDELVAPSRRPEPGQVRDSNRYAIAGSLLAMGAVPIHTPTVPDRAGALESALRDALATADGAIVTGGSSVGARDLTPREIDALGEPGVIVHGLRIRPGKPTVLAAIAGKPIIGLPGNPASAVVVLQAVVAPIIAALVGAALPARSIRARLAAPLRSRPGWTWFLPVALEDEDESAMAHPLQLRSSAVSLTARANGYVIMEEAEDAWDSGTPVVVHRFL